MLLLMTSNRLKPNGLDYCLYTFKIPLIEECQINSFDGDRTPTHLNDFDQSCITFLRNVTGHTSKNATGHPPTIIRKFVAIKKVLLRIFFWLIIR